tara:strand:- start:128 stop:247 length:120 start_codon:yes stop_codon:yes gene_type:complete
MDSMPNLKNSSFFFVVDFNIKTQAKTNVSANDSRLLKLI